MFLVDRTHSCSTGQVVESTPRDRCLHWPTENGTLARKFSERAIDANGGIAPETIQADRGTSMTSNTVTGLRAQLGNDQSHSRPR